MSRIDCIFHSLFPLAPREWTPNNQGDKPASDFHRPFIFVPLIIDITLYGAKSSVHFVYSQRERVKNKSAYESTKFNLTETVIDDLICLSLRKKLFFMKMSTYLHQLDRQLLL
ncbi:hypothetical protein BLOT_007664 [Blomia tropicalis]|nr:hypothetical protein BLOT_007664 [Blomia tropicalis]